TVNASGAVNTTGALTMSGTNVAVFTHTSPTTTGNPFFFRTIADAATTPGIGFGSRITYQAHSDAKSIQTVATFDAVWSDAAQATRKGRFVLSTADTTVQREVLR